MRKIRKIGWNKANNSVWRFSHEFIEKLLQISYLWEHFYHYLPKNFFRMLFFYLTINFLQSMYAFIHICQTKSLIFVIYDLYTSNWKHIMEKEFGLRKSFLWHSKKSLWKCGHDTECFSNRKFLHSNRLEWLNNNWINTYVASISSSFYWQSSIILVWYEQLNTVDMRKSLAMKDTVSNVWLQTYGMITTLWRLLMGE